MVDGHVLAAHRGVLGPQQQFPQGEHAERKVEPVDRCNGLAVFGRCWVGNKYGVVRTCGGLVGNISVSALSARPEVGNRVEGVFEAVRVCHDRHEDLVYQFGLQNERFLVLLLFVDISKLHLGYFGRDTGCDRNEIEKSQRDPRNEVVESRWYVVWYLLNLLSKVFDV